MTIPASGEEKLVGTYGEMRTILTFTVSTAVLQQLLPAGWEVAPFNAGASKGANLTLTFADWLVVQDPDGKPGMTLRFVGMTVPATQRDQEGTVPMVVGGLVSEASYSPGPYGVFAPARATLERTMRTDTTGVSTVDEAWSFQSDGGDAVALRLRYARGPTTRSTTEAKVHSAARPEFYRIYRIEQALDVVRSAASAIDRAQDLVFTAAGPRYATLFDGSERLISVTSVPWFNRQAFLP